MTAVSSIHCNSLGLTVCSDLLPTYVPLSSTTVPLLGQGILLIHLRTTASEHLEPMGSYTMFDK